MRSECIAAVPHLMTAYTWKAVASHHMVLATSQAIQSPRRADHPQASLKNRLPSASWKVYLASRELQNLASDLGDAIFATTAPRLTGDFERPAILKQTVPLDALPSRGGVLVPIVPNASGGVTANMAAAA